MKWKTWQVAAVVATAIFVIVSAYSVLDRNSTPPLIVYSADSYVQESSSLLSSYHNASGAPIAPVKGGGSLTDARSLGQGSPGDVFISVSLESYGKSYLNNRYSGWAAAFAADQMVLAYSSASGQNTSAAAIITQFQNAGSAANTTKAYDQAFTSLTSGNVRVGIADPNSDPAGYRGWIVLEIAGSAYHSNSSYFVNRMGKNGGNVSAGDASSLVSPLVSGNIQFLFIYKSAAIVKHLNYIQLPEKVNLGNVSYSSFYSRFTYNLTSGEIHAAPIYLFISALNNSYPSGLKFVEYVLNNSASLSKFGLTPLKTGILFSSAPLPQSISALVSDGKLTRAGSL